MVSTITSGTPVFGDYSPSSVFTVSQKLVTPRYGSYNLNIESQVTKTIAIEVGYVGSQGRHLFHFRDLNQFDNESGPVTCAGGQTITPGEQCYPDVHVWRVC